MTRDSKQSVPEWSAEELYIRLANSEDLFVFDVRNADEFEAWKIEGRSELKSANLPYFEMLEGDVSEDLAATFAEFLSKSWAAKVPRDRPVVCVCAKGDTSRFVSDAWCRLGYESTNLAGGTRAWGDYYHAMNVDAPNGLEVVQISRPARGCLSYLLVSEGRAAIIDPLRHTDFYAQAIAERGASLELVIDTHGHADHLSGGPRLARSAEIPYRLHPYDAIHPVDVLPAELEYTAVAAGDRLSFGGIALEVHHVPGHTLGNLAIQAPGDLLFCGDSIFLKSIARPDLGGRGEPWARLHYRSLRRLLELPPETRVLPGHFSNMAEMNSQGLYLATLGELAERNEGLRMATGSEDDFVAYILASLPEFPPEYLDIKRANLGLQEVDEERASELELGKNLCALAGSDEA